MNKILLILGLGLIGAAAIYAGWDRGAPLGTWHVSRFEPGAARGWVLESAVDLSERQPPKMEIYEVSQFSDADAPTLEQREAATALSRDSRASAERNDWFDYDTALGDGYELMFGDDKHYANRAYITDDRLLDPERPEFVIYYDTPSGKRLAGLMYLTRKRDERGPQIGGPLTVWHYHIFHHTTCLLKGLLAVARPGDGGVCAEGIPGQRSPEMLHVWLLGHPEGTFATNMELPDDVAAALAEGRY